MKFLSDRVLLVLLGIVSFYTYTLFWIFFFGIQKIPDTTAIPPQVLSAESKEPVRIEEELEEEEVEKEQELIGEVQNLPTLYTISVTPRKQKFNLSCEFASAATIIHHFTGNPIFNAANEEQAEKTLMEKVGLSKNPNLGIRMGELVTGDFSSLYQNLNERFGGTDYYGVHAPPFLDLFPQYGLKAGVIQNNEAAKERIQRALHSGHLVMAWIKLGFGKTVDVELSYGSIPIIRGEHTVIVHGFDDKGFLVMDPGIGSSRNINYYSFFQAIASFPMPLLEIHPELSPRASLEEVLALGAATGLDRGGLKIVVENGSGTVGAGNEMVLILQGFGYNVLSLRNGKEFTYTGVTIQVKPRFEDYLYLLKKDLEQAAYQVTKSTSDLPPDAPEDAIVIVGQ